MTVKLESWMNGVDFDNPKVIAAIQKAANEFDENAPHIRKRLEQFETKISSQALLEFVD